MAIFPRFVPHLLCLTILFACASAHAAVVTRTPYIQNTKTDEVTLMWRTDAPVVHTVEYGTGNSFNLWKTGVSTTHHEVTLAGLTPATFYDYRIVGPDSVEVQGPHCWFRTDAGRDDDEFSFFVTGDVGEDEEPFQQYTQAAIRAVAPMAEFGLICGDVVYPDGLSSDYDAHLMTPWRDLLANTPIFPALGNHDWHVNPDENWKNEWALPGNEHYYSFDWGNAHFIALDTADEYIYDEANQLAFLAADLQANTDAKWTFVYFHHPLLTCTYKGDSREIGDEFMPLFEAYGVDIVFTGHAHTYERLYPIRNYTPMLQAQDPHYTDPGAPIYIVSGCGGKIKEDEPTTFCGPTANYIDQTVSFTQVVIRNDQLVALQIDSMTGSVLDIMSLRKTLSTSDVVAVPATRRLAQNVPNPFNPRTTIPFTLERQALVRVDVYRPDGRWITNLAQRTFPAGAHRLVWGGDDHRGMPQTSGIYFLNLRSEDGSETIKMMLVR